MESIIFRIMNLKELYKLMEESPLNRSDMYFFDPVNKWTYVKPHEEYCGPYFCKVD